MSMTPDERKRANEWFHGLPVERKKELRQLDKAELERTWRMEDGQFDIFEDGFDEMGDAALAYEDVRAPSNVPFVLALVSLILSGLSFLAALTVVLAPFTVPLFLAAVVLAIIALVRNGSEKRSGVANPRHGSVLAISVISLVISVWLC